MADLNAVEPSLSATSDNFVSLLKICVLIDVEASYVGVPVGPASAGSQVVCSPVLVFDELLCPLEGQGGPVLPSAHVTCPPVSPAGCEEPPLLLSVGQGGPVLPSAHVTCPPVSPAGCEEPPLLLSVGQGGPVLPSAHVTCPLGGG